MSQRRPDTPAERIFVAASYALIGTVLIGGTVSTFSDDLNDPLAIVVLWLALVPLCLAGVMARARGTWIRALSRRR